MSEEKTQAEALTRARRVQPNESKEVRGLQEALEETLAGEAELYTQRGYGGYIHSEQIAAIRATTKEIVEEIERKRKAEKT